MLDYEFIRDNWLFIATGIGETLGIAIFSGVRESCSFKLLTKRYLFAAYNFNLWLSKIERHNSRYINTIPVVIAPILSPYN